MLHHTSYLLFESSDAHSVLADPANEDWLFVVHNVTGEVYEDVARRYYTALNHMRQQQRRPGLPGRKEISAAGKKAALQEELVSMEARKRTEKVASARDGVAIFIELRPDGVPLRDRLRGHRGNGRPLLLAGAVLVAQEEEEVRGDADSVPGRTITRPSTTGALRNVPKA